MPEKPYEYAEWKLARVGIDYDVEVGGHYYSVPCQYSRQQVDVRTTATTVEVFHRGTRLASHLHCTFKGRHTTIEAHMPPAHRAVAGVSAGALRGQAAAIGPRTEVLIE